jgi:hypothetical protein
MYFVILKDLRSETTTDEIICKIGYSERLSERLKELEKDFGCQVILFDWRVVSSQTMEKELHDSITNDDSNARLIRYSEFNKSRELYRFSIHLSEYFRNFKDHRMEVLKMMLQMQ